jgi:hypothetical protein
LHLPQSEAWRYFLYRLFLKIILFCRSLPPQRRPAFQNIRFTAPSVDGSQPTQGDVWQNLDAEVRTGETQVANNPIERVDSTFSGPAPLSSFEMSDTFNQQPEEQSFWSSSFESVGDWGAGVFNNAESFFFGPSDNSGCSSGVCEGIGIRG